MGRACWFGQERLSEQSGKHEPTGKALLPVCGTQLRDTEGIERSLVADVDLVRRPEYSAVVSVPVGRGNCATGRHAARLRRAVCAEATVAIHGECAGKHRAAGRITVAPAVPTAICLAGKRNELLTAKVRKGVAKIAKKIYLSWSNALRLKFLRSSGSSLHS